MHEQPIIIWRHRDGREIHVYATMKVRRNYKTQDRGGSYAPGLDEWSILYRSDVPSITDKDWLSSPVEEGWTQL
jgi:hypothetical protein